MSRLTITQVHAYQIIDSRGLPTVACQVTLSDGSTVQASVPSGTSTGPYELPYQYDADGKGVLLACEQVNSLLAPLVVGYQPDVLLLDARMYAVASNSAGNGIGANALLALSMAIARVQAIAQKVPLYQALHALLPMAPSEFAIPLCIFNLINGGAHAKQGFFVQECSIVPLGCTSISQATERAMQVYQALEQVLHQYGYTWTVGLEGGYAPVPHKKGVDQLQEAFALVHEAVLLAGFDASSMAYAADMAASDWYNQKTGFYHLDGDTHTAADLISIYGALFQRYPLVLCEDPCAATDIDGWHFFYETFDYRMAVTGDDLTATDAQRIVHAREQKLANTVLIKPNQVGSVTKALEAITSAQTHNMRLVVSHRSGETDDTFIADLAIAARACFLKAGLPVQHERVAKYQRLLEIEQQCVVLPSQNDVD